MSRMSRHLIPIAFWASILGGCSTAPPPRTSPAETPAQTSSSRQPGDTWETQLTQAEEAYQTGLDAYNAQDFSAAERAFTEGLARLGATEGEPPDDLSFRRRDLLRTKISYFLRQARERQE